MNIQHRQRGESGEFYFEENGEKRAEMTYEFGPEKEMVINHTLVDEEIRGKDIGQKLVEAAVDYSRKKGLKIIPVCSFAAAVFERTKSYKDVLKNE
jgi:predicted GNAT family acetyltransferase